MKRTIATLCLVIAAVALSGCYYDPGYSYVRSAGYQGDVYYGRSAPVYDDYYAAPGYYDYYGCCYGPGMYGPGVSVGIGSSWYGGARYHSGYSGQWHGGHAYGGDRQPTHRGRNAGSGRQDHEGHRRHRDHDR